MNRLLVLCTWHCVILCGVASGQTPDTGPTAEEAIIETIRSYVDAYNRRDVDAVAEHWADNAVMLAVDSQERVAGRDAIRDDLQDNLSPLRSLSWR